MVFFLKSFYFITNVKSLISVNMYIFNVINLMENRNPGNLNFFK